MESNHRHADYKSAALPLSYGGATFNMDDAPTCILKVRRAGNGHPIQWGRELVAQSRFERLSLAYEASEGPDYLSSTAPSWCPPDHY